MYATPEFFAIQSVRVAYRSNPRIPTYTAFSGGHLRFRFALVLGSLALTAQYLLSRAPVPCWAILSRTGYPIVLFYEAETLRPT